MSKHVRIIEPKRDESFSANSEEDVTVIDVENEEKKEQEKGVFEKTGISCWQDPHKIGERQQRQKKIFFSDELLAQRGKVIQRWQLPKLVSLHSLKKGGKSEGRSTSNGNSRLIKETRTEEEQLELYRSVQKRKFVTLHEELNYLRMAYVHTQKTLHLKGEETMRLRKELGDKVKEVERLTELLAVMRKKFFAANSSTNANDNAVGAAELTPSLALFAATTSNTITAGGDGKAAAKLLVDLRHNVALRDTVINNLRMELGSLRNAKKAVDDQVQKLEAELAEIRSGRNAAVVTESGKKNKLIEEPQRSFPATEVEHSSGLNRISDNNNNNGGGGGSNKSNNDDDAANVCYSQHSIDTKKNDCHHHRRVENSVSGADRQPQQTKAAHASNSLSMTNAAIPSSISEELRSELQYIRQFVEHDKRTTAELLRKCCQSRDTELRVMGAELDTARAEVDAYKREAALMQKRLVAAGFAETQLQAAQNENNALQQRVFELRDVNTAQAMREKELQSELRTTKEAHSRCEVEVESLQRRLNAFKETECGLREEIDVLLEKLARAEEKLRTKDGRMLSSSVHMQEDISSYAALMGLNVKLQERLKVLETELQKERERAAEQPLQTAPSEPKATLSVDAAEGAKNNFTLMERVVQLSNEVLELKLKLSTVGGFFYKLRKQTAHSNALHDELRAEFETACNAYNDLLCSLDKMEEDVVQINNSDFSALRSDDLTPQDKNKQHLSCVRSRLQDVQRHALVAAQGPQPQPQACCERDTPLSLRAVRVEVGQLRELLALREAALEELRKKSFEQQSTIERLRESLQEHAATLSSSPNPQIFDLNEDDVIKEALRKEAMLLDEEMNALRRELHTVQKERDYWRAMVKSAPGKAS